MTLWLLLPTLLPLAALQLRLGLLLRGLLWLLLRLLVWLTLLLGRLTELSTREDTLCETLRSCETLTLLPGLRCVLLALLSLPLLLVFVICHGSVCGCGDDDPTARSRVTRLPRRPMRRCESGTLPSSSRHCSRPWD